MVKGICAELTQRKDYLTDKIETIYLGGGTPSVLSESELNDLLNTIDGCFKVAQSPEITLEANPEDLSSQKLREIKKTGVNRLSIGIQTFSDKELNWMNRIHTSSDAISSFNEARKHGFENISIDLIYALPHHNIKEWSEDLLRAANLGPEHISIYGLTIEDRTVFGKWEKDGKLIEKPEEQAAELYLSTIETLQSFGYEQYEVSNFSKPGFKSAHNTSYWEGKPYLGVGPGAHSYNGKSRQFNIRNNAKYLKAIHNTESYYEIESLSDQQLINERILTGLRKVSGINLQKFKSDFSLDLRTNYSAIIDDLEAQGFLKLNGDYLHLTSKGFLVADEIALKLFFDE